MPGTNFAECAAKFIRNHTRYEQWEWKGPVHLVAPNRTTQITLEGCLQLCGTGAEYYSWALISSTITTWTLPILGITLLAPFESNAFWDTVFTLSRWIGNPIASIASTLWNIKVTGKAALLVDLAVEYAEPRGTLNYDKNLFAQMRDSLYILICMNQFAIHPDITTTESKRAAETLVRVAVFGRLLHQKGTTQPFLIPSRKALAQRLRHIRKRGVVPVLISIFWFLFSLVLCVQSALTAIGTNVTAHDLALGLLLGWFPVLFLSFIVDRNPTNSEDVRSLLNDLISKVRDGFDDPGPREAYIRNSALPGEGLKTSKIEEIRKLDKNITTEFFVYFSGQGRSRWHYGVAHPILADIELNHITTIGRYWTRDDPETLKQLVLGDVDRRGLIWFDRRQIWQIANATFIVLGTITGAFFLSYLEPTVGLGCRSGGYMVFVIISLTLIVLESISWWLISAFADMPLKYVVARRGILLHFQKALNFLDEKLTESWLALPTLYKKIQDEEDYIRQQLELRKLKRSNWRMRDWADRFVFRPLEISNLAWLSYICMAQTIGSYETCGCEASTWASGGGYIDLSQYLVSNRPYLVESWRGTTAVALTIMGLGLIYIAVEWCLQSHLSTANYHQAIQGLRWVRRFRRLTFPYRVFYDAVIRLFVKKRRSVLWTYETHFSDSATDGSDVMAVNPNQNIQDPSRTTGGRGGTGQTSGCQIHELARSSGHSATIQSPTPSPRSKPSSDISVVPAYGEQTLEDINPDDESHLQVPRASETGDMGEGSLSSSHGSEQRLLDHFED